MRPVCHRYSSELQISVCTMLKDAATLSWVGLVKQVLPSRDSCWLASAAAVASALEQPIAARGSAAANAARGKKGAAWLPTAAAEKSSGAAAKRWQPAAAAANNSSGQKGYRYVCNTVLQICM